MKETQESYADDAELRRSSDAQDDGNVSDVTVSSVHTSDLSSYDERISLSSEDELDLNLSILNSSRVVLKLKDRGNDIYLVSHHRPLRVSSNWDSLSKTGCLKYDFINIGKPVAMETIKTTHL